LKEVKMRDSTYQDVAGTSHEMNHTVEELKEFLKRNGISPSYHRLKIYEYLVNTYIHPSVDMIYGDIIQYIPTLSKTTIYNTLKTFVKKGIVCPLTIDCTEVRYDAEISFHAHFKCQNCDGLYNVCADHMLHKNKISSAKKIDGHRVTEKHMYFKGICKNCQ